MFSKMAKKYNAISLHIFYGIDNGVSIVCLKEIKYVDIVYLIDKTFF